MAAKACGHHAERIWALGDHTGVPMAQAGKCCEALPQRRSEAWRRGAQRIFQRPLWGSDGRLASTEARLGAHNQLAVRSLTKSMKEALVLHRLGCLSSLVAISTTLIAKSRFMCFCQWRSHVLASIHRCPGN